MATPEAWGGDFLYGIDTYDAGMSAFAAHYATNAAPRYPTRDGGEIEVVSAGVSGWPADILRMGRDVRDGRLVRDGILTTFQAEQILGGKWRRFSIGKYKVLERLGKGRMAGVYKAQHRLGQVVVHLRDERGQHVRRVQPPLLAVPAP